MKDTILNWFDAQLGFLLLGAGAVCAALSFWFNSAAPKTDDLIADFQKPGVRVLLDKEKLIAASGESYFAGGPADQYAIGGRFVFIPEKVEFVFHPIDLEIPPMGVMRPPQILPDPGPSLEGAHKLPRYGDEYPPLVLPPEKQGGAAGRAAGAAGAGGGGALSGLKEKRPAKPEPAAPPKSDAKPPEGKTESTDKPDRPDRPRRKRNE